MNQLKNTYDALVTAFEKEHEIANRIEERFAERDVEGALALETELDNAQAESAKIGALYQKMTQIGDDAPAAYFVPASADPDDGNEDEPQQMTRAAFDALEPAAKANFVANGGVVVEEAEE